MYVYSSLIIKTYYGAHIIKTDFYRILLSFGITWLLLSVPLNLLRVYSQRLYSHNTHFYFLTSKNVTHLEELYTQGK